MLRLRELSLHFCWDEGRVCLCSSSLRQLGDFGCVAFTISLTTTDVLC